MLVLVVGPSGAGKDTLLAAARDALAGDPRIRFVRRSITRPADAGGEAHRAVDRATFLAERDAGGYALWWEAHGLLYGLPAAMADDIAAGRIAVANGSRTVVAEAASRFPLTVLEITASPAVLAARLAARGREDAADIARRLAREVPIAPGVRVARVLNDAGVEEGAAAVVRALREAAALSRPAQTAQRA